MGGSQNRLKLYIKQGANPFWLLFIYMLYIHKIVETIYYLQKLYQRLGYLNPKTDPWDPIPTGPQQKDHDFPSSHSDGVVILLQRPPNSTWITATSAALCIAACLTSSTNFSVAGPSMANLIVCYFCCNPLSLSWIVAVTW